jgi:hypothetical protein
MVADLKADSQRCRIERYPIGVGAYGPIYLEVEDFYKILEENREEKDRKARLRNELYNALLFIIALLNGLYAVFFVEWPDGEPPLSTTMPWNIRPCLVVLWGVCWMFYDSFYEQWEKELTNARGSSTFYPCHCPSPVVGDPKLTFILELHLRV